MSISRTVSEIKAMCKILQPQRPAEGVPLEFCNGTGTQSESDTPIRLSKIWRHLSDCLNAISALERRTDRQTDGRICHYNVALWRAIVQKYILKYRDKNLRSFYTSTVKNLNIIKYADDPVYLAHSQVPLHQKDEQENGTERQTYGQITPLKSLTTLLYFCIEIARCRHCFSSDVRTV